jgi:foldase protein PrsA
VNNSKKLKTKKEKKKDRLIEQKPLSKISKPWIIGFCVLVVIMIGAMLFDQLYEKTILTIDGEKYKMSDVAYYFYTVESQYDYYDQMFGGSGSYWDMVFDEESGETVRDMAKEEAVDNSIYNEILYKEAVAAGYTLTEEEKTSISSQVDSLLTNTLSSSEKTKNKFNKSTLTAALEKTTLVSNYRQDKIDSFDIDDAAIKSGVKFDDFKQYDIQTLFISTNTTDADGNTAALSDEEKSAAYDKLNSYYESAKTTEDWSKLLPESEEDVTYADTNFLESGTTYSEDMEKMMMAMNNGDISEIYEAEDGYYIVKMVDNNSSEAYDNEVKSQISAEENKQFEAFYTEIEEKHEYSSNEKALASMKMGNVTID